MVITGLTRNQFGSNPTRVRIPPAAPRRSKLCIACSDLFYKSERAHAAAPPPQTATASLGCGLGPPLRGGFACHGKNIDFNRPFQLVASDISLVTSFFISLQSSSRAHSAAPRFQTEPASLGFGLGPPLRGGFFLSQKISILTVRTS